MKYFIVSDIHGFYDELMLSLKDKEYDEFNKNHHLIVVGDMADRGPKSKEVLEYLYDLNNNQKATIIKGNHDTFLVEFFEKNWDRVYFNMKHNGFDKTLSSLSGEKITEKSDLNSLHVYLSSKYNHIYKWIEQLPYFYELDKYIFVHGGVDGSLEDWRNTTIRDLIWSKEYEQPPVKDRVVISGHQRVATIRVNTKDYKKLFIEEPHQFEIMYLKDKILIDGFVEISKTINVLTIEI